VRYLIPVVTGASAAVIGLLAGLAIWSAPPAPPPAPAVKDAPVLQPAPAPRAEAHLPLPPATPGTTPNALDRALEEAVIKHPLKPGNGELTGRIALEDGSPLPGIEVRARPHLPGRFGTPWPEMEQHLERQLARIKQIQAGSSTASTNADGEFRLAGLVDARYFVTPISDRYHFSRKPGGFARPGGHIEFVAIPASRVILSVLNPDGSQAAAALISGWGPGHFPDADWTPQAPPLKLVPGAWTLTAWEEKNGPVRSEQTRVYVPEAGAEVTAELRLQALSGIAGRFLIPPALHQARFEVRRVLEHDAEQLIPDERGFLPQGSDVRADGRFHFYGLEQGDWIVALFEKRGRELARQTVSVGVGITEVEIPVPGPDIADFIPMRVFGPDGAILRDIEIRANAVPRRNVGAASLLWQPDGSVWLSKGRSRDVPGLEYWDIIVVHDRLGFIKQRYGADESRELEMRFQAPATLTVEIANAASHPRREYLSAWLHDANRLFPYSDPVNFGGEKADEPLKERYTFESLQPGRHIFRVAYGRFSDPTMFAREVDLESGEQTLRVEIPVLHDLTMELPEVEGVEHAMLFILGQQLRSGKADEQRRVTWRGLPAGVYRVTVPHALGAMLVRVPSDLPISFDPREPDAWEVSRLDVEGIARRAGLLPADIILSINGESGVGEEQLNGILSRALQSPQLVLQVRRPAETLTVTLPSNEYRSALNAHFIIRPALAGD
jgi:hypothetical protein